MKTGRLSRRTPLRKVSKKRQRIAQARRDLVAVTLAEHPWCQARTEDCTGRSVDVHERLTRARGGSILDPSIVIAVCRACHRWIHEHQTEAHERGLLIRSWAS